MPLGRIANLLADAMGLDASSIGLAALERSINQRKAATRAQSLEDYLVRLSDSPGELRELIEAVVVPETWFFRHHESFVALRKCALERFSLTKNLRVLSIPSSTGEEPYSMAMTLLDAGFSAAQFHIDAVDISERSLAAAKTAVYGRNSFRGRNQEWRDRFFSQQNAGWCLKECVRDCVAFRQGNLLDANFLADELPYDFVFCRNLLIYFDQPTQARAINKLRQLQATDGLLFVGPAEPGLYVAHGFVSAKLPLAFALVWESPKPMVVPTPSPPAAKRILSPLPSAKTARVSAIAPPKKAPVAVAPAVQPVECDLDTASRLADQGNLEEATRLCQRAIGQQGPSARAFYLLGLARDVAGDPTSATGFYTKTLYLDPGHYEALMHLAFLNEKSGDRKTAELFKARAKRSKAKATQ